MGVADTENRAVRVAFITAPPAYHNPGDPEAPGQLTGREMMALGHVLTELGAAMLGGDLRRDANKR